MSGRAPMSRTSYSVRKSSTSWIGRCAQTSSGIMRKAFWIWQFTAWTAVVILALVMLFWESGMRSPSPPGIFPVRALDVRMERSAHEQFVAQMRSFGDAFGFKMLIKPSSPRPYDTFFQMWRHDVDLTASNRTDAGAADLKFGIHFYPKRDQPAPPPENVAPLVEGLRHFLGSVPNAVVTEVSRPHNP